MDQNLSLAHARFLNAEEDLPQAFEELKRFRESPVVQGWLKAVEDLPSEEQAEALQAMLFADEVEDAIESELEEE